MSFHFLLAPDAFQYGSSVHHVRRTSNILFQISNWIFTVLLISFPKYVASNSFVKRVPVPWSQWMDPSLFIATATHLPLLSLKPWTRAQWDVAIHWALCCIVKKGLCHLQRKSCQSPIPGIRLLETYHEVFCCISKSIQALTKTKRYGDIGHPWRIPEACFLIPEEPKLSLTKHIGLE